MQSIGEVARQARLRASAIRYYERLGLLPAPARSGGRRQYGQDVLDQLAVIRFARQSGFTLCEIRQLFTGRPYSERLRHLAGQKILELSGAIERARRMQSLLRKALRCTCMTPEECGRHLKASPRERRQLGPVDRR